MSQRKTRHGIVGSNVRSHKKSGNQAWAFSFDRQAPEIPAKCPRCGEQHFVHDAGQLVNGVSKSQCHGCTVDDRDDRQSRSIAGAVGKSFDAPANAVRFANKGRGVTADRKNGPWDDMTRTAFLSPGRYRIVGHEGSGDTSVYIVTRGPGEKFLKVMAWHAYRRIDDSIVGRIDNVLRRLV